MTLAPSTYSTIRNSGWVGNPTGSLASNSFSPAAGDLIVVMVEANLSYQTSWITPTITDSLGSHLTWTLRSTQTDASVSHGVWVFAAPCPSAQTNMTVTVTAGTSDGSQYMTDMTVQAITYSGADASTVGTIVKGSTSTQNPAISVTPTQTGSAILVAACKFASGATVPTAGSNTYLRGTASFGQSASGNGWYGTSGGPTLTSGSAVTVNLSSGQATTWQYVAIEILPAGGGGGQQVQPGVAAETDAGQPVARRKKRTPGITAETDTAQTLSRRKGKGPAPAAETDAAQTLPRRKRKTPAAATETDGAQPLARTKRRSIGVAMETDAGQPVTRTKARALGIPGAYGSGDYGDGPYGGPADVAQPLAAAHTRTLGVATETDAALPVATPGTVGGPVGPATETDTATPLARVKRRGIGPATETATAAPLGRVHARPLGVAASSDTATGLARVKAWTLTGAQETDLAAAIGQPAPPGGWHDHRVTTRVRPDRPRAAVRPDRATRVRSDP